MAGGCVVAPLDREHLLAGGQRGQCDLPGDVGGGVQGTREHGIPRELGLGQLSGRLGFLDGLAGCDLLGDGEHHDRRLFGDRALIHAAYVQVDQARTERGNEDRHDEQYGLASHGGRPATRFLQTSESSAVEAT
ncbi:MAG: hypothetical protein M3419_03595 [Actinomycetota bacterium]|nr:hypothetical protein [Actinomycetota bacterium]